MEPFINQEVTVEVVLRVKPETKLNALKNIDKLDGFGDKLIDFEPESDIVGWILTEALYDVYSTTVNDDETIYSCSYNGKWSSRQFDTLQFLIQNGAHAETVIKKVES